MSTISPLVAKALATAADEQGARMLDAPVSGGDKGAIAGTLSIMVGGDAETSPRLSRSSRRWARRSSMSAPGGAGQTVKACNQIVVALAYQAISEALVLGARKAGVEPKKIIEVLNGGLAATRVMEMRGATMIEHNFTPGFRLRLHHKDLGIALKPPRRMACPSPRPRWSIRSSPPCARPGARIWTTRRSSPTWRIWRTGRSGTRYSQVHAGEVCSEVCLALLRACLLSVGTCR